MKYILLILLTASLVSATQPPLPATLYFEATQFKDPDFIFVDHNNQPIENEQYFEQLVKFTYPQEFENIIIQMDGNIIDSSRSSFIEEAENTYVIQLYKINFALQKENSLSTYEGKTIDLHLDATKVRTYQLGYKPPTPTLPPYLKIFSIAFSTFISIAFAIFIFGRIYTHFKNKQ